MHCKEISFFIFPEKELRGLSPISTFIYSRDRSTYFPAAEYADRSLDYINRTRHLDLHFSNVSFHVSIVILQGSRVNLHGSIVSLYTTVLGWASLYRIIMLPRFSQLQLSTLRISCVKTRPLFLSMHLASKWLVTLVSFVASIHSTKRIAAWSDILNTPYLEELLYSTHVKMINSGIPGPSYISQWTMRHTAGCPDIHHIA